MNCVHRPIYRPASPRVCGAKGLGIWHTPLILRKFNHTPGIFLLHCLSSIRALLLLLFLIGQANLHAAVVELKEIPISLYNKPVIGYRMTLDRGQRVVEQQILKHVSEFDSKKPFQFEKTIIYEEIRYSPITDDPLISLHFLLRGYENHYTELTVVAMYDLRRSINTRDFPDLALKFQIDLAKLVRKINGDQLKFGGIVFDDAKIKELQAGLAQPPVGQEEPPVVSSRTKVVMNPKTNTNQDSVISALKRRIAELESKEKRWNENAGNLRNQQQEVLERQSVLQAQLNENSALKDSVAALNKRMKSILGQYYHADDVSVSNETVDYLTELEQENKKLEAKVKLNAARLDSLGLVSASQQRQIKSWATQEKKLSDELLQLKESRDVLLAELEKLKSDEGLKPPAWPADSDSLMLQLKGAQRKNASQTQEIEGLKSEISRLEKEEEGLGDALAKLQEQNLALESENKRLNERLVSNRQFSSGELALLDSLKLYRLAKEDLMKQLAGLQSQQVAQQSIQRTLEDSVAALRRREVALQTKIKDSRQNNLAMNQIMEESQGLRDSLTRLNKRLSEMGARLQAVNQVSSQQSQLTKQVQVLRDSVAFWEAKSTDWQGKWRDAEKRAKGVQDLNLLRDTLQLLQARIQFLQGKAAERDAQIRQLEEQNATHKQRETELKSLKERMAQTQSQIEEGQAERKRLEQSLGDAQSNLNESQRDLTNLKAEQERLAKEKATWQSKVGELEKNNGNLNASRRSMADTISLLNQRLGALLAQAGNREIALREESELKDSLQRQIQRQLLAENEFKRLLAQSQRKVDSLSRLTMPSQDQQRFIRDQWAKLTAWEETLVARDKNTANQEKLIAQKQTSLDGREKEVQRRELAIAGLEERERQVSLREQQVNTRENLSGTEVNPADVKMGKVEEMGTMPVFSIETMLNFKAAQKQVVAYMLSRDLLLSEQSPDLFFKNVYLSELAQEPLDIRIKIDSRAGGTVLFFTFRTNKGGYLGDAAQSRQNESIKQFIVRILRYRI